MKQKIINKVPHAIYILNDNNQIVKSFPKSSGMIRIEEHSTDIGHICNVPISSTVWGKVYELPASVRGTYYIVSQLVKNALPERPDLLVPREVVRDTEGNILGCKRLDLGNFNIY